MLHFENELNLGDYIFVNAIFRHDSNATLKPDEIATLNLCVQSFPPSSKPTDSTVNIFQKKSLFVSNHDVKYPPHVTTHF